MLLATIAIVVVVFCSTAAHANPGTGTTPNDQDNIPPWVSVGGGIGGGSAIGVMVKTKLDEITEKAKSVNPLDTSFHNPIDYTNSPQYLKDKIHNLEDEVMAIRDKYHTLSRQVNYIEKQLIRNIDGYQSCEEHREILEYR